MLRNNLSSTMANMISAARKAVTGNLFIINDYFDIIRKIIKERELSQCQIWNCDKIGFPTDPTRRKVVSVRGEVALKQCGEPADNSTLATCNTAGRTLVPLIIFTGKKFQSTWYGIKYTATYNV